MNHDIKNPNMSDVARVAGVSKMTVSRVLRGYPGCSKETIEKVRNAAESTGYRNNPIIATLMSDIRKRTQEGRRDVVIAVLDDATEKRKGHILTSWEEHLQGIHEGAAELGYKVETFFYRKEQLSDARLNKILITRNVKGIVVPYQLDFISLKDLQFSCFASVTLGYTVQEPAMNRVVPDYFMGLYRTLEALKLRGYKRFALVVTRHVLVRIRKLWLGAYLTWHMWNEERTPVYYILEDVWQQKKSSQDLIGFLKEKGVDCVLTNINDVVLDPFLTGWFKNHNIGYLMLNWTGFHHGIAGLHNSNSLQGKRAIQILNEQIITNNFGIPRNPVLSLVPCTWVDGPTVSNSHIGVGKSGFADSPPSEPDVRISRIRLSG